MATAGKEAGVDLGATGRTFADNMRRIRTARRLTLRDVADLLEEIGHPIAHSGLSKIENYTRRVDVDDLVAVSLVLNVSPLSLLLPDARDPEEVVAITGTAAAAEDLWRWAQGVSALPHDVGMESYSELETWTPEGQVERLYEYSKLAAPWWHQRARVLAQRDEIDPGRVRPSPVSESLRTMQEKVAELESERRMQALGEQLAGRRRKRDDG